ncbi:hypothetical protein, partial [Serratia nevei]|uniref:hypothetical protein n=1 Tax=Serratia nevei TaxID=2703794 RepID=UPI00254EE0EC
HRSVRLVILVGLAIDQIAQSGLSSLSVIYYSAQLFSKSCIISLSKYPAPSENIRYLIDKTCRKRHVTIHPHPAEPGTCRLRAIAT